MTHLAYIAKIDKIQEIEGANTIQIGYILGTKVIISKEIKEGYIGVFFPSELQLSEKFCEENNLFRHSTLNKDCNKKGFFEDNRRVRCQPFMKIKSDGFFIEIESLSYTGTDLSKFKLGDSFAELDGNKICEKYISEKTRNAITKNRIKKPKSIEAPSFLPHIDTDQFKYYVDSIPKESLISISSKQHGTSFRCGHVKTVRNLSKFKKFVNKFIPIFNVEKWEYVNGTRRVVLFEENFDKVGFHGSEQFRFDVLEKIKPHLIKNLIIYGEIYGWANDCTIMPNHDVTKLKDKGYEKKYGKDVVYKYGCREGEFDFMIYRIALCNEDGFITDFTPPQIEHWCTVRGFKYPKNIVNTFIYDGNTEKLRDLVEELTERPDKLTEDYIDPSHISEGVVVRCDHGTNIPMFYKNKSYAFKVLEGIAKENEIDIEDAN